MTTPTTHNIPSIDNGKDVYGPGHFKSEVTLLIEGSSRSGGPGGWFLGGWSAEGEGRTVTQGPMVQGPYAYVGGRCGVIDNHGGTHGELERADGKGLLFRCKAGDILSVFGTSYTLSLCRRGYPTLTPTN